MADKRWLNIKEAADYLGVSRPTIYSLMDRGLIPYSRIKGIQGRRIKKEDLDALFEQIGTVQGSTTKKKT